MNNKKTYAYLDPAEVEPLSFSVEICNGCNKCVDTCQIDIMIPNPEKEKPPIVLYPGECWYDGSCVSSCPRPGAIKLNIIPKNNVSWKRKTTGEDFYLIK